MPEVTSRDHPSELCFPCFICSKRQPRYAHFSSLTTEQQHFFQAHFHKEISRGCMCRAHVREADKHNSSLQYIPVWKKDRVSKANVTVCMHPNSNVTTCSERIITCSSNDAFKGLLLTNSSTDSSITVCETHYQQLYRQLHTLVPCTGCGKIPKVRQQPFNRHSPDAISVSEYLLANGLEGSFTKEDTICKAFT